MAITGFGDVFYVWDPLIDTFLIQLFIVCFREIDQSTILRSAFIIQLFSFIHLFSERITIEIEDQSSCGQKNGLIIQLIGFSALMILML